MKYPVEFSYILDCLGYRLFPNRPLPLVPNGIDWDKLYSLLSFHQLAAYFCSLHLVLGADWPVEFFERLRDHRYMLLLYYDQCGDRIAEVLSTLRTSGVDVIVLKGWAFIQTIYGGNRGVRFCEDIDILVRLRDSEKAATILRELEYRSAAESWPGYAQRFLNAQAFFPITKTNNKSSIPVGLHWGLLHKAFLDPVKVQMEALFASARPLNVTGVDVLELSIEDQIVYGCAHLVLHHLNEIALYRYYEIGALIRRGGEKLDWKEMIQRAQEWQCVFPLKCVLGKLELLWPGMVPVDVVEEIDSLSPVFKERFIDLWAKKIGSKPYFDHILNWIATPGLRPRFEIIFQDLFPSREYMLKWFGPAPRGLWPILYFRRFFRSFRMGK